MKKILGSILGTNQEENKMRITSLKEDNVKLVSKQKLLSEEKVLLQTENASLNEKKTLLQSQNESLNEEKMFLQGKNKSLVAEANQRIQEAKTIIEERDQIIDDLRNQLDTYQKSYGKMDEKPEVENALQIIGEFDRDANFLADIKAITKNDFNAQQLEAIRYPMDQHLRIIAGAGSGKTETICTKAAYLYRIENVKQSRIGMITFTRKAANEMKERVNQLLRVDNSSMVIGTFHNVFSRIYKQIVKRFPDLKGEGVFVDLDRLKQNSKTYKDELNNFIQKYKLVALSNYGDKTLEDRISFWLSMDYSFEEMQELVKKHFEGKIKDRSHEPISQRFYNMMIEFYQFRKDKQIGTFDDMMTNLYNILKKDEEYREFARSEVFDFMFVDEFQDTNPLQMGILELLCPPDKELEDKELEDKESLKMIIVGDDDQSIYAFRGSDPKYIKEFSEKYSTHSVKLMTNYRSKENIVHTGNRVIKMNDHDRLPKSMEPFHNEEGLAFIQKCTTVKKEAEWIVQTIKKLEGKMNTNYRDYTVLYRSSKQVEALKSYCIKHSIPFVISPDKLGEIFKVPEFTSMMKGIRCYLHGSSKNKRWEDLLNTLKYKFFISNNQKFKINETDYDDEIISKFVEFVQKRQRGKHDLKDLREILYSLEEIRTNNKLDMNTIFQAYFRLPANKSYMSVDSYELVMGALADNRTWKELSEYCNRLKNEKEDMADNLKKYQKGEYNALQLTTIHSSKGLSFPNVFVIGCYQGGLPSNQSEDLRNADINGGIEKAEPIQTVEEERRLMYVAVTRAKKNLFVTAPAKNGEQTLDNSIFLKELGLSNGSKFKVH